MLRLLSMYWIILIIFFYFTVPVFADENTDYYPGDTWRTSTPEAQGIDSKYLAEMMDNIQSNNLNFHSIIIIRHGYIVMEAYAEPFDKDVIHVLKSCTKSVVSALTGIALREGYIKSLDQKVMDIFSGQNIKNMDDNKRLITIKHLLTMSSGITQQDVNSSSYLGSTNWSQYYLDQPMVAKPGELFAYDNAGVNLFMSILHKTSGMKNSDFADKFLFKPLGITNYFWSADPQGDYIGAGGLAMTPIDMARFGYLYLKKGNWKGKQIIPADWVETSMSSHIKPSKWISSIEPNWISDKGYGFLWWELQFGGFTAVGYGGQYIMVIPEKDMVVVVTSGFSLQDAGTPLIFLAEKFTNESYVSRSSLPENPAKQAKLAAAIWNFDNPTNDTNITIPEMAKNISGKKYIIYQNPQNLKSVILSFNGNSESICEINWPDNLKISVGLDGKYRENNPYNDLHKRLFTRGKWINKNTFVLENYTPWVDSSKIQYILQYKDDKLKITAESTIGEWVWEFTGKIE